ncbi:hypothetical protein AK812_SmicGene47837, partial [Symbiodinium microadriaticum]
EVLVATQEEVVPQFSPEVVVVEASPEDKPRDDGAQEREVERKLVVLIERLEQAVPEHSPLWLSGMMVLVCSLSMAPVGSPPYPFRVANRRGTVEALQWKLIGAGYEAIGVQAQGLTYTMISLYLKDTEGPTGPRNAQILASLVAYVRELPAV